MRRIIGHYFISAVLIGACLAPSLSANGQRAIPELWGLHVHDDAHALTTSTVEALEARLVQYEDSTSNQIAILLIPSLEGEILEDYALRVAEKWQLGQKDNDNGALLLIAVNDRKMRIEVGQGLEGVLTDAMCSRIMRNELSPAFRKDDYDGGISAAIDAMIGAIGGEYSADATDATADELSWKERILLGLFIFVVLGIFTAAGVFSPGCAGWFLYVFLIPFYALFPMVVLGTTGGLIIVGIYIIAYPLLRLLIGKTAWGERISKKVGSGSGRGGGWMMGSGSSGGWSSGGGGGGFSGGGGSFGGGGSSGSW
ncbi:MAG: TPM domain-containing protein [Chryseolinea sp.]